MGTNYYANGERHPCPQCGEVHGVDGLHIGKDSFGWAFALAIHEDGPKSWPDWMMFLSRPGITIQNEYGTPVTLDSLVMIVTAREGRNGEPVKHSNTDGQHCIRNGAGTWDEMRAGFR